MEDNQNFNPEEHFEEYNKGWGDMMLDIWRTKLKTYGLSESALYHSLYGGLTSIDAAHWQARFRYEMAYYGLYVNWGAGRSKSGGKEREKRPWCLPSWNYSRRVLANELRDTIFLNFEGLFDNLNDIINDK